MFYSIVIANGHFLPMSLELHFFFFFLYLRRERESLTLIVYVSNELKDSSFFSWTYELHKVDLFSIFTIDVDWFGRVKVELLLEASRRAYGFLSTLVKAQRAIRTKRPKFSPFSTFLLLLTY